MISNIIPTLKYQNAEEAISWLCEAFGFEQYLVVPSDDGKINHAQLTLNGGMIMLSSVGETPFDKLQTTPKTFRGIGTQSPYIVIEDVDKHYNTAVAVGAEILMEPEEQCYGGRLYTCRDPEGHIWSFGSYNPWL